MARLTKVEVTAGIVWVEVAGTDLRILCGCPADAVKHLMRRGLIRPTQVAGVPCETGPNVILLSDVMVQNGAFCNLGEFPVLQMFYRQGMLLPGHPNNTGVRPVLVGRRDQVDAQMQYIYRGNYGLISEEELVAADVEPDLAREMMRLKLRFAFGHIQHPRSLLDPLVLEDEAVELQPGITIRRIGLNRFVIACDDEQVEIDLNLAPYQVHECPFPLGAYQFHREYFAVVHSGEGDGWDIRRPSMGTIVVFQGRIYLIDAGPNLLYSLTALGIGINEVEGIFHTHSHDDHFAGLSTLMQADHRIKYFAVPMVRAAVAKKLSALLAIEEENFEDYFEVRNLTLGAWNDLDGLEVLPQFSPHPVETTTFRFRAMAPGGYRSYAHMADVVGLKVLEGMVTDDPQTPGLSRARFQQVAASYLDAADIKKVDIGGGMIHGMAEDFRDDRSGKIILAHTAQPFTAEQKRIGSGASFGTVDVLIPTSRDFIARAAFGYLSAYFPDMSADHLGALLNGRIRLFNPETILLKGGAAHHSIYLLLTGQVELLDDQTDFRTSLSAGALLGEMTGLHGLPASETCRAVSFVQVLEIACDLYIQFVRRHSLFGAISRLMERREFLSRSWLLSGVVSTGTLNGIAHAMRSRQLADGSVHDGRERVVGLIKDGRIVRKLGDTVIEVLTPGDFFGEETAVFDIPAITTLCAEGTCEVEVIPANLLVQIPNVRWKMFETFARRMRFQSHGGEPHWAVLRWNDEYSLNIQRIDAQHRRLFATANTLLEAVQHNRSHDEVGEALDFLLSYTLYHFAEEEALLASYLYPEEDGHKARHRRLIAQVKELAARLSTGLSGPEVLEFLESWIVNHILVEDRRYAEFLNAKGVF